MVDIPGNSSTNRSISVGGTLSDTLEVVGDRDWVRIELTAGQSISVSLDGLTLEDAYLRIRDASGNLLYENDDINPGVNRDSLLGFTASYSGTYFIEVGAWEDNYTGTYQLSVSSYSPPPLATVDEIADQLVAGYWGGSQHRFNVTQGGSLTVNLTGLTAEGQQLARSALAAWTDVIGVNFVETGTGGKLVFDDDEEGAHASSIYSGGFISSSDINVSVQWLTNYGTSLNGYAFQAYIHEIGHALGLGHAGNYNGEARYPFDALFQNDSWSMSIMSYFDQQENTYFAGQGFTKGFVGTPMMADIVAMARLYGLSTTTRAGDTVYGFDSTANRAVFNASIYPTLGYTIFDSGGIDTVNYSGFSQDQRIDLNPETFSNVGGRVGNVAIARGTTIENAIGGSGNDEIRGNGASNRLDGGSGNDTLTGAGGDDLLIGGTGADAMDGGEGNDQIVYDPADNGALVRGGAGTDTLIVNGASAPTSFNLAAQGFERAEVRQSDTGANPWSSIVKVHNSSWALVQQVTTNDDSSRTVVDVDATNSAITSQVWSAFDPQGRLSSVDQIFDNGTRTFINLDEAGNQIWTQDWLAYDAQGRLSSEDVHYDSGTRTFINIDETGGHNWTQDWFTYDALGRLSSEDVLYDNGTRTVIDLDQDNSHSWRQAWFNYDAQGRLDTQDVLYDDGSRIFYNYDQAGSQPYAVTATLYNSQGTPYQQVTTWDDGSMSYALI